MAAVFYGRSHLRSTAVLEIHQHLWCRPTSSEPCACAVADLALHRNRLCVRCQLDGSQSCGISGLRASYCSGTSPKVQWTPVINRDKMWYRIILD